jgi:hypothetical protein
VFADDSAEPMRDSGRMTAHSEVVRVMSKLGAHLRIIVGNRDLSRVIDEAKLSCPLLHKFSGLFCFN